MGATNVENPSATAHRSASTRGHTLGKSPTSARIVENPSGRAPTSLSTGGSTQERSHMSAGTAGKPSHTAPPLPSTRELMLGRPTPHVLGHSKALSYSALLTRFDPVILLRNNTNVIHKASCSANSLHPHREFIFMEMIVGIPSSGSSIPGYQIIQTVGKCGVNHC